MIDLSAYAGKIVAVLGLGRSGAATVRALLAAGAVVWAWDDDPAARGVLEPLGLAPLDLSQCDWTLPELLVISPGIPTTYPAPHPAAARARAAGTPIRCDVALLCGAQTGRTMIAITGTNGKSTTAALCAHILSQAGRDVRLGGNIGAPVLDLDPVGEGGIYVLELSSYQLELIDRAEFAAGALLNITPDHLDRHGGMDGYVAAKRRLFDLLGGPRWAIIGQDDAPSRAVTEALAARGGDVLVPVSCTAPVARGLSVSDGWLIDTLDGPARPVIDLTRTPRLPGRHNAQNIAVAYGLARACGLDADTIAAAVTTFPGLAHRQEWVGASGTVQFVNDSKATNAEAAATALAAYDDIYWIAGGRAKDTGLAGLEPHYHRVRAVFLIGEAQDRFAAELHGKLTTRRCTTLARAVDAATAAAMRAGGGVVLLSPACASFDQFPSFEARGDAFRALVGRKLGTPEARP